MRRSKPPAAAAPDPEPTHFLNVDLELAGAAAALQAVAAALDPRLFILHHEVRGKAGAIHYELSSHGTTPELTLRGLCRALERLTGLELRAWRALRVRDLNVGIQAGRLPHFVEYPITPTTLARVAHLRTRLVFTVYAPFPRPRQTRSVPAALT